MINRRIAVFAIVSMLLCGSAMAASRTYKYRCPRCKLIQEYGTPGVKKCPNDGLIMVRQN